MVSLVAGLFDITLFVLLKIIIGILDPKCRSSNKPVARLDYICSRDHFPARWFMRSLDMARSRLLAWFSFLELFRSYFSAFPFTFSNMMVMIQYSSEQCYWHVSNNIVQYFVDLLGKKSGFGGLRVACWPLVPKFAGSNPAEAVGFLGRKNPQHAFLRRGSKAVGPMS